MESVLACLFLRNRHEQQARHPIRTRPNLELVRGVAQDNPAQGLGPPSTERGRIVSVDDDLLPNEIHVSHSATSVSQADPPTGVGQQTNLRCINCCTAAPVVSSRPLEPAKRSTAAGCSKRLNNNAVRAATLRLPICDHGLAMINAC
jgi:hypothetical protein